MNVHMRLACVYEMRWIWKRGITIKIIADRNDCFGLVKDNPKSLKSENPRGSHHMLLNLKKKFFLYARLRSLRFQSSCVQHTTFYARLSRPS